MLSFNVKQRSIKFSTIANQVSVVSNILLGVVLLPFINNSYGIEGLNSYILFFAYKSIIDLFTSSLGGAFIREMLDNGIKGAFELSRASFFSYTILILFVYLLYELLLTPLDVSPFFIGFIWISLIQQPYLQRLNASGYQYVGAISRITYNLLLLLFISTLIFLESKDFDFVFVSILIASFISLLYIVIINFKAKHKEGSNWETGRSIEKINFFLNTIKGYSLFAIFLGLTFQVEIIMLSKYVNEAIFAALIVGWKVPNIIVQFIWRYSEVSGLDIKRKSVLPSAGVFKYITKVEKNSFIFSLTASVLFLLFGHYIYIYWMGDNVSNNINLYYILTFSLLIPILCANRVYTSILQYTGYIDILAKQYVTIFLCKLVSIIYLSSYSVLSSMIVWACLELIFLFFNRRAVKHEFN